MQPTICLLKDFDTQVWKLCGPCRLVLVQLSSTSRQASLSICYFLYAPRVAINRRWTKQGLKLLVLSRLYSFQLLSFLSTRSRSLHISKVSSLWPGVRQHIDQKVGSQWSFERGIRCCIDHLKRGHLSQMNILGACERLVYLRKRIWL